MWIRNLAHLGDSDFMRLSEGAGKPRQEARVREHLRGCETCSAAYGKWRHLYGVLEDLPLPEVPDEVYNKVRLRLARENLVTAPVGPSPSVRVRRRLVYACALAAILLGVWGCMRWYGAGRFEAPAAPSRLAQGTYTPPETAPPAPIARGEAASPHATPAIPAARLPWRPAEHHVGHRVVAGGVRPPWAKAKPSPPSSQALPAPTLAVASRSQGTPMMVREGRIEAAAMGTKLASGDELRAGETDRLLVELHDRGQILVDTDSEVRLAAPEADQRGATAKVRLLQGRVWAWSPGDGGEIQVRTASGLVRVHRGEAVIRTSGPEDLQRLTASSIEISALRGGVQFQDDWGRVTQVSGGSSVVISPSPAGPPRVLPFSRMITKYSGWGTRIEMWGVPQLLLADVLSSLAASRVSLGVVVIPTAEPDPGMKVAQVQDRSVAGRAGVQAGDILLAVAGKPVTTFADLAAAELRLASLADASLVVLRGGGEMALQLHYPRPTTQFPGDLAAALAGVARVAADGDLDSALAQARALAARQPKCVWTWYDVGLLEEYLGNVFPALVAYKHAADLAPANASVALALGRAYARNGNLERSEGVLRKAISLGAGPPAVWLLGYVFLLDGNKATGLAQAATLLASPAPEARALGESLRGHFAYFEDNLKEAQADLNLALQTDPNNVNIQCSTATVDLANRQVELARSFFQVVIRGYPDWAKALNMMGNTYYGQKRWLEARAWDERALSCPVLHEPVLCNLAETYVRTGDLVRATCILRSVVENSPTFSAGHLNLGYALEKSGDWQGAAREYETVLELRPNDHEALKWLTGLYRRHGHPELAAQFDTRYGLASAHTAQPPQAGG